MAYSEGWEENSNNCFNENNNQNRSMRAFRPTQYDSSTEYFSGQDNNRFNSDEDSFSCYEDTDECYKESGSCYEDRYTCHSNIKDNHVDILRNSQISPRSKNNLSGGDARLVSLCHTYLSLSIPSSSCSSKCSELLSYGNDTDIYDDESSINSFVSLCEEDEFDNYSLGDSRISESILKRNISHKASYVSNTSDTITTLPSLDNTEDSFSLCSESPKIGLAIPSAIEMSSQRSHRLRDLRSRMRLIETRHSTSGVIATSAARSLGKEADDCDSITTLGTSMSRRLSKTYQSGSEPKLDSINVDYAISQAAREFSLFTVFLSMLGLIFHLYVANIGLSLTPCQYHPLLDSTGNVIPLFAPNSNSVPEDENRIKESLSISDLTYLLQTKLKKLDGIEEIMYTNHSL